MNNPYFSVRPPACVSDSNIIAVVLLKLSILAALGEGLAVSYAGRFHIFNATNDTQRVARVLLEMDPPVANDFVSYSAAVDHFVTLFIKQSDMSLSSVVFHVDGDIGSPALSWATLINLPVSLRAFMSHTRGDRSLTDVIRECVQNPPPADQGNADL